MNHLPNANRTEYQESSKAQSPSWLRRAMTGGVFVSIGVIMSIVVAWGCALWSHLPASNLDHLGSFSSETDPTGFDEGMLAWRRGRPDHFPEKPLLITPYLPGKGVRQTEMVAISGPDPLEVMAEEMGTPLMEMTSEEIDDFFDGISEEEYEALEWPTHYQLRVVASGWPMHSLQACVWNEDIYVAPEFDVITDGIALGGPIDHLGELNFLPLRPVAWGMLVSAMFWGGLSYLGFRRVMCFCGT